MKIPEWAKTLASFAGIICAGALAWASIVHRVDAALAQGADNGRQIVAVAERLEKLYAEGLAWRKASEDRDRGHDLAIQDVRSQIALNQEAMKGLAALQDRDKIDITALKLGREENRRLIDEVRGDIKAIRALLERKP